MKVKIEIDENAQDTVIIIKCRELTADISKIQHMVTQLSKQSNLTFYKDTTEYILSVSSILFFETSENCIYAHTADDMYTIKS